MITKYSYLSANLYLNFILSEILKKGAYMNAYMDIANSWLMFFLCGLVVSFVLFQAIVFMKKALKRANELNMDKALLKKVMISSSIFSIIPSLPILVVYIVLLPTLGQYFPWLRLSVVGSGVYENMAADVTAKAFGLSGISDPSFNLEIFISALFVMTIGIIWSPLYAALGSKYIIKGVNFLKGKHKSKFNAIFASMFIAMLCVFAGPYLATLFKVSEGGVVKAVPFLVFVISALSILVIEKIAKIRNSKTLVEFSFSISLVVGMASAILLTQILG